MRGKASNAVELSLVITGGIGVAGSEEIRVSNRGVALGLERRVIQNANGDDS